MEQLKTKLEYVAIKTCGIKLDAFGDKWINPTDESKATIMENINKIAKWKGKVVVVNMVGEDHYSGMGVEDSKEEEQKQPTKQSDDIIRVSGKDFMLYKGLLNKAHIKDSKFSMTIIDSYVSEDMKRAWCIVRLTTSDGRQFDGFGSSTPENTGKMTQSHPIEMAHTRAKGRSLRDFLNIGETMYEEINND